MLLYLDDSVLNRLFDDQSQPRIWFETVSLILILTLIESGECTFIWSPFNELENVVNPEEDRREWVSRCSQSATIRAPLAVEDQIRAKKLEAFGLKPLDALHLAYAERLEADVFLTCDDRLLRRYSGSLKVLNPSSFIDSLRTL